MFSTIIFKTHIYNTVPFPSPEDFETFVQYKVKYGIVSNEFGIFIVKNNNVDLNLKNVDDVVTTSTNIKKKMEKDFQKAHPQYGGIIEDDKDDEYYGEINKYVKQNYEKYVSLYRDCLSKHEIDIMFIKTK